MQGTGAAAASPSPAAPGGGPDLLDTILAVLTDWRVLAALGFTLFVWVVFRSIGVIYRRAPRPPAAKAKAKATKKAPPSRRPAPAPQEEE